MSGTRLVALVSRTDTKTVDAWASVDGRNWQPDQALSLSGGMLDRVAARGTTLVAVGTDAKAQPAIWRSTDGGGWSLSPLPSAHAIVRNIAAVADGFVLVGREGSPDTGSGVGVPGTGRPAAWWSSDGRGWIALSVEGVEAPGAQLNDIFTVSNGFIGVGSDTTTTGQNPRAPLLWLSVDARTWTLAGPPPHWGLAGSNGQVAVVFSYAGLAANPEVWIAHEGRDWTKLVFSGDTSDVPVLQQVPGQTGHIDRVFVEQHGVVVIGQQNGHASAWFATGVP